jgi:hypothetical protein
MWKWLVPPFGFLSCLLIHFLVTDAAQLDCVKAVPYKTLKDTVISTGAYFFLLFDSTSYDVI